MQIAESAAQLSVIYDNSQFLLCRNPKQALGKDFHGIG
jgi:hypothetical protein